MIDLSTLNEEQKKAVQDTEGPVLVFAGAGSGKTRVLTYRIAYLIGELHVNAWNILAITFTNKATREMQQRLTDMLGENSVWVSTFHSLCVKILFRYGEKIGYTSGFSIYDESASSRALGKVLREKHLEEDKDKSKYAYHISLAKNAGLSPDAYFNKIRKDEKDAMLISEVYQRYDEVLHENNAMDFDDLLMKCYILLRDNEDVRTYYATKFRYIHVDEFQDTNGIQFEILKLLACKWQNVFAVGDDDQSIYGWRGADIRNILDFDKSFPNAKTHKLEQNYRSTQEILDSANRLIRHNTARSPKALFTESGKGNGVEYNLYSTEYEEVDSVIDQIKKLKRSKGYTNKDFAILVRNNALTRLFEQNLNRNKISYRVYGGFKFFDRKEILDVLAYLKILVNPADTDAIVRVINLPKRGIGDTTVEQMLQYAAQRGETLYDVIMDIAVTDFSVSVKSKIAVFRDLIGALKQQQKLLSFSDFCQELVGMVGFETYYRSTGKEDDLNRWENIEEFLTYVEENYKENTTPEEFLHTVLLNMEKSEEDEDDDTLTLATMHAVKGLEFPVVFIVACEEGTIPSSQSLREDNGVDEERRVMYVAITRARDLLYISAVNGTRRKYNRTETVRPSRFMSEAKGTQLVAEQPFNPWKKAGYRSIVGKGCDREQDEPTYLTPSYNTKPVSQQPKTQIQLPTSVASATNNAPKDISAYHVGTKVRHKKYGIGTIIIMDGEGNNTTVTVAFKDLGVKKFTLQVAPLEIV